MLTSFPPSSFLTPSLLAFFIPFFLSTHNDQPPSAEVSSLLYQLTTNDPTTSTTTTETTTGTTTSTSSTYISGGNGADGYQYLGAPIQAPYNSGGTRGKETTINRIIGRIYIYDHKSMTHRDPPAPP